MHRCVWTGGCLAMWTIWPVVTWPGQTPFTTSWLDSFGVRCMEMHGKDNVWTQNFKDNMFQRHFFIFKSSHWQSNYNYTSNSLHKQKTYTDTVKSLDVNHHRWTTHSFIHVLDNVIKDTWLQHAWKNSLDAVIFLLTLLIHDHSNWLWRYQSQIILFLKYSADKCFIYMRINKKIHESVLLPSI